MYKMGSGILSVLVVIITLLGLAAAKQLPDKQWLTREDLQQAMAELRLEYMAEIDKRGAASKVELDDVKSAHTAEAERMQSAFNKDMQRVQDALNEEREANRQNAAKIISLQDEMRTLKELEKHRNTDSGDMEKTDLIGEGEERTNFNDRNDAHESELTEEDETEGMEPSTRNASMTHSSNAMHVKNKRGKRVLMDEESLPIKAAFSVALNAEGQNLGAHQTIHFDKVITNLGNSFDTRLSFFTAPVSGWYVFSVTLMSRPSETQEVELINNGAFVFRCFASGTQYDSASRTMVIHVEEAGEVWVQTATGLSPNVHGYEHTTFSGWLLYSD